MVELFKNAPSKLDDPIDALLEEMEAYSPEDPQYQAALDALERLTKLRAEEYKSRINWDLLAPAAAHIVGIGMIIAYEQKHVMTSKALTMVIKPKLP